MSNPHDLLPIRNPLEYKEDRWFFYSNVVKPLIKDIIRICNNGTPIDLNKVQELDNEVSTILNNNREKLKNNILIKQYLYSKNKDKINNLVFNIKKELLAIKDVKEFDFDYYSNKIYRSYVVNSYLDSIERYKEYKLKEWTLKDIKKLNMLISSNFINGLINKTINKDNEYVISGYNNFIKDKIRIYNRKKALKIKTGIIKLKENSEFNPNSSLQKVELFSMLGIELEEKTKTGNDSIGKIEVNRLDNEYKILLDNEPNNELYKNIKELLEIFIDQSSAAIIKNTFIKSFYLYTIDSVLYSKLNLFGAKSFRLTSNHP